MIPLPRLNSDELQAEALHSTHLVEHSVQLIARLPNAIAIIAIHHEDQALRVLEVVAPQRADLRGGQREGSR